MRYIVILMLLFSCSEEEVKNDCACKTCFNMTISDSIPIKFWLNGVETFNEKVVCGLSKQECFCQPFQCDDEITIQFQDDEYDAYDLDIVNDADDVLRTIEFTEISAGVWQASFTPSESSPSICERIKFVINVNDSVLDNPDFTSTFLPWYNFDTGGGQWVHSTNYTNVGLSSVVNTSDELRQDFLTRQPGQYSITLMSSVSTTLKSADITVRLYNNNTLVQTILSYTETNDVQFQTHSQNFTAIAEFNRITIIATWNSGTSFLVEIDSVELIQLNFMIAQSDCIDLKESHLCTQLIEYTNSTDFDGIVYEGVGSPAPTFYLRIPAMFHQDENPQTQEDSELSNGEIVTRRQTIQEKVLLETGYMPNYMHLKVQKVLMHETVILNNPLDGLPTQWKRRDAYEANPIKKYNLKTATVLLTKYNSVERNTI